MIFEVLGFMVKDLSVFYNNNFFFLFLCSYFFRVGCNNKSKVSFSVTIDRKSRVNGTLKVSFFSHLNIFPERNEKLLKNRIRNCKIGRIPDFRSSYYSYIVITLQDILLKTWNAQHNNISITRYSIIDKSFKWFNIDTWNISFFFLKKFSTWKFYVSVLN